MLASFLSSVFYILSPSQYNTFRWTMTLMLIFSPITLSNLIAWTINLATTQLKNFCQDVPLCQSHLQACYKASKYILLFFYQRVYKLLFFYQQVYKLLHIDSEQAHSSLSGDSIFVPYDIAPATKRKPGWPRKARPSDSALSIPTPSKTRAQRKYKASCTSTTPSSPAPSLTSKLQSLFFRRTQ